MQPLTFHQEAVHFVRNEAHLLYLDDDAPQQPLRLALIVRGSERHIFPALALDDWGREKKGLGLYRWLYEQGPRFPRAEIFGFDDHGNQTQIFLRDLEISFKYPCYVYGAGEAPVEEGERLGAIYICGESEKSSDAEISAPDSVPWALRRAAVRWRQSTRETLQRAGWQPR
jgi:hypothetical protein